jgi:hypothetical protein
MWGNTIDFITKHCELLQCFQYVFFPFFLLFFSKIVSVDFIFFNIELIENLAL